MFPPSFLRHREDQGREGQLSLSAALVAQVPGERNRFFARAGLLEARKFVRAQARAGQYHAVF